MSSAVASHMAQSHGPLLRTNTTPVFPTGHPSASVPSYSQAMSHNSSTSQLSGSTAFASSSTSLSMSSSATLAPLNPTPQNGGPVVATNNIINQKADASKSLYQICVNLRQRLAQVPGFEQHINDQEEDHEEETDPVSALWRCLRKGTPLMTIYNTLQPPEPLVLDKNAAAKTEQKRAQHAAFKFVKACLEELHFAPGECFVLSDLFGDDTTGFVKVTQVINIVLDEAETRGLLSTKAPEEDPSSAVPGSQMSYRDHVVRELVETERKYVQDLENLHDLKRVIEQRGVIAGDIVHDIFLNINAILDFQRRFLIKIETTNSQANDRQEWGLPFTNYEEAFGIYQPFIANQRKAASIAQREFDKISLAEHPVVVDFNTLDGFLLKPMQRLVKYPLLLKDLRDKTGADEETKADLTSGIEAANRVLTQANDAVDRELRNEALADLCTRVDDWKNHRVDHFGDLLLYGHFPVVTGKTEVQKEYTIYLFERILLCCKEVNPNKSKDKLMGAQKDRKDKKDKKGKTGDKNAKLQLKGRIFMTNVTEVLSLGKQGSYTVQIFWKGDPGVENFIIKFSNEETMKKWYAGVDRQRKEHTAQATSTTSPDAPLTDFAWMRDQTAMMPNPYAQEEEDDDDDYMQPGPYPGQMIPRNASNNSLRSRSATGESTQSLAGIARAPLPRYPMGAMTPALSLQTQISGPVPSPGPRGAGPGDSYFSPTTESPVSSMRTSVASQMFPFPRQGTTQQWEDNNRYTAPARAPSRDSQASNSAYKMNPQRPSLPAMASQNQQNSAAAQRSRSYSTPDINNQNGTRRLPNGQVSVPVPAVPGIPAHLAYDSGISRSQNTSPNGLPVRTSTQSPGAQRERQQSQYTTNASSYSRANTAQIPINTVDSRTMSPPLGSAISNDCDIALPTQLKVKVNCDGNYVTLVVAFNISYQSLIDRIDAKVGRFSNNAIARGTMRLRYRDEDEDFVTIESDDDIQIAFQEWREAQKLQYHTGQLGEIELFCLSVDH